jgi:hypothetical protein
LYQARVLELQREAQTASRSGKTLEKYREQRLKEEKETRKRALLSIVVPLFGLGNQLYELLLASRRYHRSGDPRDAVDVAFGTIFLAVELLLSFVPGPKLRGGASARSRMGSISAGLNRIHRSAASQIGRIFHLPKPPSTVSRLKPLERFRIKGVPQDAVALTGPGERGIYVKGGEHFTVDDTHHTPIYRRDNERSFRLKNKAVPGEDELILNIHEPSEVLLGADAPVAGPSSGVLNPWRAPAQLVDWQPPITRTATENRVFQSSSTATHWLDWRTSPPLDQPLTLLQPDVFHLARDSHGFATNVLRIAPPNIDLRDPLSGYYKVLPGGGQPPMTGRVFIHRDETLVSRAHVDIERWTSTARMEQPIPVSRTPTGDWVFHAPLFDVPLEQSVREAFPTLTTHSRKFTVIRLVEQADSSRVATATHLLNIRATLDDWLPSPPHKPGQTDDLLRMLRPTEKEGRSNSIKISYDGKAPGFTRVDFQVAGLDPALRSGGGAVAPQRKIAQRTAVKRVLEQQGFIVQDLQVHRKGGSGHELMATHPLSKSNKVYYLSLHWHSAGSITLEAKLTDNWLKNTIKHNPFVVPLAQVKQAMSENRLRLIVAGIQWPVRGNLPPSVYFVKVNRS